MRARLLLVVGIISLHGWTFAQESPQVGTWDITGTALAHARYDGHTIRTAYPFDATIVLEADGTYRASTFVVGCAAVPEVTGRWHASPDGRVHGPLTARTIRAAVKKCAGRVVSLEAARSRVRVLPESQSLVGSFHVVLDYRLHEAGDIEHIFYRVRGQFVGSRRVE